MKKIISLLLALVMLSTSILFTSAEETVKTENTLRFNDDGTFRIMQLADLQDNQCQAEITKRLVAKAIEETQPDLIVLTGDNITAVGNTGPEFWAKINVKKAISNVMDHLNSFNIPIAVVFGNHDAEGYTSKEEQMAIYMSYDNCVAIDEGEALYGCGTYNLPILASDSDEVKFNIWCVDSNMYDENGAYDYVHDDQIEWYVNKSNELKEANGGEIVPSFVFQHIIVNEIYQALFELGDKFDGIKGEDPCPPAYDGNQFESIVAQGDVLAMFFGHDHVNNFVVPYQGVDLVNTPTSGFGSYGDDSRGIRIIDINEKNPEEYETFVLNYLEMTKDNPIDNCLVKFGNDSSDFENIIKLVYFAIKECVFFETLFEVLSMVI